MDVETAIQHLLDHQVEAIAVSLYNSYTNPAHERRVAEIIHRVAPHLLVSLSVDVDPRIGEYERVSTCALNAMAMPVFHRYADDLNQKFLNREGIRYMHSGGGLLTLEEAKLRPIQLAKSGPAGGALAASAIARHMGFANAVTIDIGGTSTDICLMRDGEIQHREIVELDYGIPARIRSLDIHAIGAGGGSLVSLDAGGAVRVGPRSAGAVPGPACYGRGGTAAVTDANLVLGIVPQSGLLGGNVPLDRQASILALDDIARELDTSAETLAEGVWAIVNASIAHAIREITVQQGTDIREFALVAFGGAGPQHAVGVAAELGIKQVIIPNHCSVLSAIGLLTADLKVFAAQTALLPLEDLAERAVQETYEKLHRQAVERLGSPVGAEIVVERFAGLRYVGQWHYVPLALSASETSDQLYERFEAQHEILFGTRIGVPVEIVDIGVTVIQPRERDLAAYLTRTDWDVQEKKAETTRPVLQGGVATPVPVYTRATLAPGTPLTGPCLVEEPQSVTYVPDGSVGSVTPEGYLSITVGQAGLA
jgi:N-methylhydantoinase A